ncbi:MULTISPECIES: hypothetical protein [Alkalimonas]|uniref:Uncharacterized protein n=1 Tax=Alkalimonas mucilaginosa TaxID=3057676 RepID=A0ABU7JCY2_9GAMM|nr:hypothetical protein [Alkalimonas sp. MEB004]MEE2023554.1 hypothetical protein [Alkalimonas sp. MEB004]
MIVKQMLCLTMATLSSTAYVSANETATIDMSSPTEAYTAFGLGYGNDGFSLKTMFMTSKPGDERNSGFIFEVNDITDKDGGKPKFSGISSDGLSPQFKDETTNTNFRFRYGSVNTTNGIGKMIDAIVKDHPFYGTTVVVQAGALATIPVSDNAYIWPVILLGGVVMEDNTGQLVGEHAVATRSSGMDWASTIFSAKIYARYKFNDAWWLLGAWTYTDELMGKDWSDSIRDGGLELSPQQIEITLGYQITSKQNLRLSFHSYSKSGGSDRVWLEYNYAF